MESGGDERVFIGQMVGLADRVGSDVIPDVALDERSHRQTPISYSFVFAKENGRSAQDGDVRFRGIKNVFVVGSVLLTILEENVSSMPASV